MKYCFLMGVVGRQGLAMVECRDMQIECSVHKGGDMGRQ